jgi:hypothetical protein
LPSLHSVDKRLSILRAGLLLSFMRLHVEVEIAILKQLTMATEIASSYIFPLSSWCNR